MINEKLIDILKDKETYTTVILAILLDKIGTQVLEWDPVTVSLEIEKHFGFTPQESLSDKIQAGATLITTNMFHSNIFAFNVICNSLSFSPVISDTFIPADIDDVLWGCTEAKLIEGEDFKISFEGDIQAYVGVLLEEAGIYDPPSILNFADYSEEVADNIVENTKDFDETFTKIFWGKQEEQKELLNNIVSKNILKLFKQIEKTPLDLNRSFLSGMKAKLENRLN